MNFGASSKLRGNSGKAAIKRRQHNFCAKTKRKLFLTFGSDTCFRSNMSASEQMRAMLDQLMGTARNGELTQSSSVFFHVSQSFLRTTTRISQQEIKKFFGQTKFLSSKHKEERSSCAFDISLPVPF